MSKGSFTIHDLPPAERPRERLQKLGPGALSAQELLAVILGRGVSGESVMVTAQRLLARFGNLKRLSSASVEELEHVRGIGPAKATQLKAAFELALRADGETSLAERPVVKTPEDVAGVVKGMLRDQKREHFLALLLDTRGRLIRTAEVSVGSLDTSIIHPREVFREAISASAASVIFAHNHPSGDPQPSDEDVRGTKQLVQAGELVGIEVLDHVILGERKYISLKREGVI